MQTLEPSLQLDRPLLGALATRAPCQAATASKAIRPANQETEEETTFSPFPGTQVEADISIDRLQAPCDGDVAQAESRLVLQPGGENAASVSVAAADAASSSQGAAAAGGQPARGSALHRWARRQLRRSRGSRSSSRGGDSWSGVRNGALVVEGYVIGADTLAAKAFWVWGRWLYDSWLAQEHLGLENLPLQRGMFFMASNHQSHLDCGAIFMAAWAGGVQQVYALGARDYFFQNRPWAWFVTTFMHVIPFSRRGFSQAELEVLLQVKQLSSAEKPTGIVIFPEGTRSQSGTLQQFKAGVALLAEQLDVPVVPVCVKGTLDALPKGRGVPHRHKIRVQFGKPVDFHAYTNVCPAAPMLGGHATNRTAEESPPQAVVTAQASPSLLATAPAPVSPGSDPPVPDSAQVLPGRAGVASAARGGPVGAALGGSTEADGDAERRGRREAQKQFAADLREAVARMLGGYGQARRVALQAGESGPALAQRLGGGKWNLVGWLAYWLPMAGCMVAAVGLAASQVYRNSVSAGPAWMGAVGYAAAAGVFNSLPGVRQNSTVFLALGIICVAFYLRNFVQWLWPYIVLDCRED